MPHLSFVSTYVELCQHHTGDTRDGTLWVLQQNKNFGVKHFAVLKDREGYGLYSINNLMAWTSYSLKKGVFHVKTPKTHDSTTSRHCNECTTGVQHTVMN